MSDTLTNNKSIRNYETFDNFTAGIVLTGSEVKSLRDGGGDLSGSLVQLSHDNQVILVGLNIAQYKNDKSAEHKALRPRTLLLNASEIRKLAEAQKKGYRFIPSVLKKVKGRIKLEFYFAKNLKKGDKREKVLEKEHSREAKEFF